MSLLLDALHRGHDGKRGKAYTYLYSLEESAESDVPLEQVASTSRPGLGSNGSTRSVRKIPSWILLVGAGSLTLVLFAGFAWFWYESSVTSPYMGAYSPPTSVVPMSPVTSAALPVEAPAPVSGPKPTEISSDTSNTSNFSVPVVAASPSDQTGDDGRLLAPLGDSTVGQAAPKPRSNRKQLAKDSATNEIQASNSVLPAQPSAPMSEAVAKSELAFELANAWALLERGQWAEAEADYRRIIGRSKIAEPDAVLGLAVALHRQKRWADALAAYETSLRVWPGNPVASSAILDILAHTNAANAESRLKQWIADRPQDAAAFSTYGLLLGRKASWPDAVGMLRRARELEPSNGIYAYNLAVALDQSQRHAEAVQQYQAALGLVGLGGVAPLIKARLLELAQMGRP